MNTDFSKTKFFPAFTHILYLTFFTSLIFSFRGITSISLGVMLLAGIAAKQFTVKNLFDNKAKSFYLAGCILLFLLHLIALLYTSDRQQAWTDIRIKAGLIITPLAAFLFSHYSEITKERLLAQYCLLLALASLYCLLISFIKFTETHSLSAFFYHELASPIHQHAVYFSVLIAIGLIILLESIREKNYLLPRLFHSGLAIYLSAFLFLLSSKLVIGFYLLYFVYYFLSIIKKPATNRRVITSMFILCIAFISLLFVTRNPINERFRDVLKGDVGIIRQETFKEGDYFNGLQFRLLQWRFVAEILTENKKWWLGVSPGNAQTFLNKKYLSKHMYAGNPSRGDHGYLIYNTHNQFLETLLQTGIIGLIALLGICFCLVKMALREKNRIAVLITLLLLLWLFTESVLETQYGIVIFTFFPFFISAKVSNPLPQRSKANLLQTYSDI